MLKFTLECKHFIDLLQTNDIFTNMGNLHLSGMMPDKFFKNMKKLLKNKFFIERQPVRKILFKKLNCCQFSINSLKFLNLAT